MGKYYYPNLCEAVAAINGGTTGSTTADNTSKVELSTSNGVSKLRLLADLSESQKITVSKDVELVLNSYCLRFTEADANLEFGTGTNCVINGAGGQILKELDTEQTESGGLVVTNGTSLRIKGGTYTVGWKTTATALTVLARADTELLEVINCSISTDNSSGIAMGIQTQAKDTIVSNVKINVTGNGNANGIMSNRKVSVSDSFLRSYSLSGSSCAMSVAAGALSVKNCALEATAQSYIAYGVWVKDGTVSLTGSRIQADAYATAANGAEILAGELTVSDCTIVATSHKGATPSSAGIAVNTGAVLRVKDSQILADSTPIGDNPGNNTLGISNYGTAYLENNSVSANHSGVQNAGKLYVNGGRYNGYCHGGFYFTHGPEGEAFVNDAILQGGRYDGIFDYSEVPDNIKYGTMYIGGGTGANNSNITAYLDGCVFDTSDCHRAIIIRGSLGEQNNTLNISNCLLTDGTLDTGTIRIDNETMKLNIGRGCNTTSDMFKNGYIYYNAEDDTTTRVEADYLEDGVVEYTGALYRKFPE